jgi:hypothetical protein
MNKLHSSAIYIQIGSFDSLYSIWGFAYSLVEDNKVE